MKKASALFFAAALPVLAAVTPFAVPEGTVNLAAGKPVTFSTPPSYSLCRDSEDPIQLTDGKMRTKGAFWTEKSTVGWSTKNVTCFTIDLGQNQPIKGFAFNTAAGRADVTWPKFINVYTSIDKTKWYFIGDLFYKSTQKTGTPDPDKYAIYNAGSLNMDCCGRYVSFVVDQQPYCFVDEIQVFKGDDALLGRTPSDTEVYTPISHLYTGLLQNRLTAVKDAIAKGTDGLPEKQRNAISDKLDALKSDISQATIGDPATFLTVLPLCPAHESLLAINAEVLQAKGFKQPVLWSNCRWDNLDPIAIPAKDTLNPRLEVEMMRNEIRSESLNLLNPTSKPLTYDVTVDGLPKDANVLCRQVLVTETKQQRQVGGALKPGNGKTISVTIPAGTSTQLWFTFEKPAAKPGTYKGTIVASAKGQKKLKAPITLVLHDLDFPERPRLHVGGWDYTNNGAKVYRAPNNLPANLASMRRIYVDCPWATNGVSPAGAKFDKDGKLTNKDLLDFTQWDKWVALWKDARLYCVFAAVNDSFLGEKMGTPRFAQMVGDYYTAWTEHMVKQGLKPSQLVLLLVDEPYMRDRDERVIAWGKVLKEKCPEIVLFEDPIYAKPTDGLPAMYEISDVLCPNLQQMKTPGSAVQDFFLDYQAKGKELWLYSCSGPARSFDPISYYRAQEWACFALNAKASFYWAFGCGGGIGDSWHAYAQKGTEYSPYFVSQTDTMSAKQSEALLEGVQDYEYLSMLKDKIAELKAKGKTVPQEAEKLLKEAPARALCQPAPQEGTTRLTWNETNSGISWFQDKDRTIMDKERIKILRALDKLSR